MHVIAEQTATSSDSVAGNSSLILDELARIASGLDFGQLARLADKVSGAERVFLAGAGRSGLVLRMAAMRLMHLGLTVHVAGDTTTPAITEGDLLLVASGSGTTSGVVKAAETALAAGAGVAAVTTNPSSALAGLADALVVIPAAQKTDHGSAVSRQYSGSLFEQSLFLVTESVFQTLWEATAEPAEKLWLRHANLE
ncbi:6-phospho-3-hexuloisomerase [Paenarthrobacter sp. JL.01a]|uniref:6-phospho-3-hexuloisomerase n=1 Tax=Paenarthrobacter sp. JL.01a TaxID=2979324 RepID=UPI0021CAA521|nr:6-phospho-3-hexuloisomerase [Paenarthrobacter sp. JL.01a]UXM92168.1 6-phospho-3-hexuloisomerase [Paenarthrobacter sp. JL.01a]